VKTIGLAGWDEALAALTPRLALAIGPMVRSLDVFMARSEPVSAASGEPDGYGGLTRRGDPHLMLVSEWLLADEFPEEFLRRAADRELLHLAPEFRRTKPRGRVVALVASGPAQAGAGRLVQLAALLVLHRRALTLGTELLVGAIGQEAETFRGGDLPELLPWWLSRRGDQDPDGDDLQRSLGSLNDADEAWVIAGPGPASSALGHRRMLTATESAWDETGATSVRVVLAGSSIELPLPNNGVTQNALRGAGFRREKDTRRIEPQAGTWRHPTFNSAAAKLLLRTEDPSVIASLHVPTSSHGAFGTPRKYDFGNPVVAAAWLGHRLVAVVMRSGHLAVEVIGRKLGGVSTVFVPCGAVYDDDIGPDANELSASPVAPLFLSDGMIVIPVAGRWWLLGSGHARTTGWRRAQACVGPDFTHPLRSYSMGITHVRVTDGMTYGVTHEGDPQIVFGAGAHAHSADGTTWLTTIEGQEHRFTVDPADEVIALVAENGIPVLVTQSRARQIVRVYTMIGGKKTLAPFSGGRTPTVHPTLSLIAVQASDGKVRVGDVKSGNVLLTLGEGA
jgi:hypothetical protein